MDARHRRLYLEWCQSPPTTLGIGPRTGPFTYTFSLPIDLLYHRSRIFRDLIVNAPREELIVGHPRFDLPPSISPHTVEDFVIWSLSHSPQISSLDPSFEEATNLGVFAQQYHIPALTNQITDSIREHIASDEWTLQASLVDAIYGAAPAGTPLREVVRAALGKLPRLTGDDGGKSSAEREEWKAVILKHSQLGWDFIEAGGEKWTASAYLSGVCKFHDHEDVKGQKVSGALCDGCPFVAEDCFPIVEGGGDLKTNADSGGQQTTDSTREPVPASVSPRAGAPIAPGSDQPVDLPPHRVQPPSDGTRVGNSIMVVDPTDNSPNWKSSVATNTNGDRDGVRGGDQPSMDLVVPDGKLENGHTSISLATAAARVPKASTIPTKVDEAADDGNGTTTSDDVDEPLTPVQEEHMATPSEPIVRSGTGASEHLIGLTTTRADVKAPSNIDKADQGALVDAGTSTSDDWDEPIPSEMAERSLSQDTTSAGSQKETGTMTEGTNGLKEELKKPEAADAEVKLNKSKSKKKKKRGNSISVGA